MKLSNAIECLRFLPKKIFLEVLYHKRVVIGKRFKASWNTSLILDGRSSYIRIGKSCHFRSNTEIMASNGTILFGNNVFINKNCMVVAHSKIEIGDGTTIGPNCLIYDHDHSFGKNRDNETIPITIGKDVWIGGNAVILKGVHIDDKSVIAAGSIVTKDIPAGVVYIQPREHKLVMIDDYRY